MQARQKGRRPLGRGLRDETEGRGRGGVQAPKATSLQRAQAESASKRLVISVTILHLVCRPSAYEFVASSSQL